MKKLLALLLLSPLLVSEKLEYPVELTCEAGPLARYIYLDEDKNKSWISDVTKSDGTLKLMTKRYNKKSFKNVRIFDDLIELNMNKPGISYADYYVINRYNLRYYHFEVGKARIGAGKQALVGKCYKGFKTYSEKQI